MPTQSWFTTQIYTASLQREKARERDLRRRLLREITELREADGAGLAWSKANYGPGFTSYASVNDLPRRSPTFAELERAIDAHVRRFVKSLELDLGGKKLEMTTCWANVMPKGAQHSWHIHPLSVISGTYYVVVPKGASALKFEDPRLDRMMASPPRSVRARRENRLVASYAPEAGQLILFESWLRHEVPLNRSQSERISISFNYA